MTTPKKDEAPKETTFDVVVRQTPDGSHYEAGIDYNGAWLPLNYFAATDVDSRVQAAAADSAASATDEA